MLFLSHWTVSQLEGDDATACSRSVAADMWRLFSRRAHQLATKPGATLRVVGSDCAKLIVKTNMETYVSDLEGAAQDGKPCSDEELASWAIAEAESGDLTITTRAHAATISVPASFNVSVEMEGACDVDMNGWLEGTVEITVGGCGSVGVNTVRGLLTSVSTMGGNVRVDHIEGNLDVRGAGDVQLGKIMGEEVAIEAAGAVKCRALYAKELKLEAKGGVTAAVLSAEVGEIRVDAKTSLESAEGELTIHVGAGDLEVQASEALRKLHVEADAAAAPSISVHVPEGFATQMRLLAEKLDVDERLLAQARERPAGLGGGPEEVCVAVDAGGEGATPCDLTLRAAGCSVSVAQQSWFEQRMKMAAAGGTKRRPSEERR